MGTNKGKKYIKLVGDEVATKASLRAARAFMYWYGAQYEAISKKLIYAHKFDDEVATETALKIYQDIELKGLVINGKYKWYYLRAYHTNYIAAQKKAGARIAQTLSLDAQEYDTLSADDYDFENYEKVTDYLRAEVLEYVRANFDAEAVSLFEIYMELQPEISYKKLAVLLGLPHQKIWRAIGEIKKAVVIQFDGRRNYLLSIT